MAAAAETDAGSIIFPEGLRQKFCKSTFSYDWNAEVF